MQSVEILCDSESNLLTAIKLVIVVFFVLFREGVGWGGVGWGAAIKLCASQKVSLSFSELLASLSIS